MRRTLAPIVIAILVALSAVAIVGDPNELYAINLGRLHFPVLEIAHLITAAVVLGVWRVWYSRRNRERV